jgi:oligopeptide/dipeptide ABC transporter ATP-binding protein
MTSRDVVLEAHDLVRRYSGGRALRRRRAASAITAVDGVRLTLRRGETLGVVGESGSGKSTLARLLTGLERPSSGRVLVDGEDIFALPRRQLRRVRRKIQIVLQNPYSALNPRMSVRTIVREPFDTHPDVLPRRERDQAVQQLLDAVGLAQAYLDRFPHELSGGQLQRIAIARALALRPQIIVCDEPVSALDVSIQAQVINVLADLQREYGIACVFIAHDLAVVRHVSDRIAVMYRGRFVETGETDDVYDRASHPYTQALQHAAAHPAGGGTRSEIRLPHGDGLPDPARGCSYLPRCPVAHDVCRGIAPTLQTLPGTRHACACHFPAVGHGWPHAPTGT